MSAPKAIKSTPIGIAVNGKEISRELVIYHMQMMEAQKKRVDALLLAVKNQMEPGGFDAILVGLAKELQEDHASWYALQDLMGIREQLDAEASHE